MKFIADIGNSRCRFALFDDERIILKKTYDNPIRPNNAHAIDIINGDLIARWLADFDLTAISEAVIIAVTEQPALSLTAYLAERNIAVRRVGADGYGIACRAPHLLQNLGADRAMNILGGKRFVAPPFVAIDCGTATTVDYCDHQGLFGGGVIIPGARLMAQALHDYTEKLPLLQDFSPPPTVIGDSTEAAIAASLTYGYADMINGIIKRIETLEKVPLSVILCGGGCEFYADDIKNHHILQKDLTLWGGWCYSVGN